MTARKIQTATDICGVSHHRYGDALKYQFLFRKNTVMWYFESKNDEEIALNLSKVRILKYF